MNNQQEKLVLVDGEIMPMEDAFVDINDRGHNLGDGVLKLCLYIMDVALLCCLI